MKIIDQRSWPRSSSFAFFSSCSQPHFEITARVDITHTLSFIKKHGIAPFSVMMWLVCKAANEVKEFKYRVRAGQIVEHDTVHPSFTWLNEDKNLTFCLARYTENIRQFINNVEHSKRTVTPNAQAADAQVGDDALYISCLPWLDFTAVSHPVKSDDTSSIPRITWGKFSQIGITWSMPVAVMLHHGLADGYHVGLFFKGLQRYLNDPEKYLRSLNTKTT